MACGPSRRPVAYRSPYGDDTGYPVVEIYLDFGPLSYSLLSVGWEIDCRKVGSTNRKITVIARARAAILW